VRRFWHPQGGGRGSGAVGPAADGPPRRPADRAVALAALLFVFLPQPTGVTILLIAAGLLVMLAVIEFLAARVRPRSPHRRRLTHRPKAVTRRLPSLHRSWSTR
jgi:hypothetical protein